MKTKTLLGTPDPFTYGEDVGYRDRILTVFDSCDDGDVLLLGENEIIRVSPGEVSRP